MILFHGGCHGCTMQDEKGIKYCVGCRYFDSDWSLPSLNNVEKEKAERINRIKEEARAKANN